MRPLTNNQATTGNGGCEGRRDQAYLDARRRLEGASLFSQRLSAEQRRHLVSVEPDVVGRSEDTKSD